MTQDPKWFEPTKTPTVFHAARREGNGMTSALCDAALRLPRGTTARRWEDVPSFGQMCPKCRDRAAVSADAAVTS